MWDALRPQLLRLHRQPPGVGRGCIRNAMRGGGVLAHASPKHYAALYPNPCWRMTAVESDASRRVGRHAQRRWRRRCRRACRPDADRHRPLPVRPPGPRDRAGIRLPDAHRRPVFHGHSSLAFARWHALRPARARPWAPRDGQRFNPAKLLIDPHGRLAARPGPFRLHPLRCSATADRPARDDADSRRRSCRNASSARRCHRRRPWRAGSSRGRDHGASTSCMCAASPCAIRRCPSRCAAPSPASPTPPAIAHLTTARRHHRRAHAEPPPGSTSGTCRRWGCPITGATTRGLARPRSAAGAPAAGPRCAPPSMRWPRRGIETSSSTWC